MKTRFYLACLRDNVGGNVAFHSDAGDGYPTDVNKAGAYSLENAQRAWEGGRGYDQPISADHVDAHLIWKVDCQRLPIHNQMQDNCTQYVAFQSSRWRGNDVYWVTEHGMSVDFSQAKILSMNDINTADERLIYVPFTIANTEKRQTFDYAKLNKRTMIQGAGLRLPADRKRIRRRKANPKSRWNCPSCGKLHWQHNPHDFEGCKDSSCESWT